MDYRLERADFIYKHQISTRVELEMNRRSEIVREHCSTYFVDDKFSLKNYEDIGKHSICYEFDYSHSHSNWLDAPKTLWTDIRDLPVSVIKKITYGNIKREYGRDPITAIGKENCTVCFACEGRDRSCRIARGDELVSDLINCGQQHLNRSKCPRSVGIADELPRFSPVQLLKRELQARY